MVMILLAKSILEKLMIIIRTQRATLPKVLEQNKHALQKLPGRLYQDDIILIAQMRNELDP